MEHSQSHVVLNPSSALETMPNSYMPIVWTKKIVNAPSDSSEYFFFKKKHSFIIFKKTFIGYAKNILIYRFPSKIQSKKKEEKTQGKKI